MRQNIIQLFKTNQAARAVTSEGHYQGLSEQVQIIWFEVSIAKWLSQGKIISGSVQWIMPSKIILLEIFYTSFLKGI